MAFIIIFGGFILLDLLFLLFLFISEPSDAEKKANFESGYFYNKQTRRFEPIDKE